MFRHIALTAALAAASATAQEQSTPREKALLDRIEVMEQRIAALEKRLATDSATPAAAVAGAPAPATTPPTNSPSLPGFAASTTLNFILDGYYEYNFNRPLGEINLLRPYDPLSNNFSLNQAVMVVERAPDPAQGRRFGLRLDLMFGQTTSMLAGNPANEPRPDIYRNIYQAYGTYVAPVGKGLTIDLGRFSSPLGMESTYSKDQINYSRSLLFTALPFYHMGFRTAYKASDRVTFTWMSVNGINQTEDFNGFKSNHFMVSTSPTKNFSWTGSYWIGEENRNYVAVQPTNTPPPIPTQPGLSTDPILPRPNGRVHIANTYLTWNATPKLTLAAEADYIVSRSYETSAPTGVTGAAGYVKYQFSPKLSLADRFEYVSDRGGYLSGLTQALKENTITASYQPADGFMFRGEYRRDFSNQPFFFTRTAGITKKDQNTALLALIWWFGGKQGSW